MTKKVKKIRPEYQWLEVELIGWSTGPKYYKNWSRDQMVLKSRKTDQLVPTIKAKNLQKVHIL